MRPRIIPFLLLLMLAASISESASMSFKSITDAVVARHMAEKRIPGMSVAVVHEGRVLFSEGYGEASIEFSVPAGADTVYPISSVSRVFAAVVALKLAAAGSLNLDASISEYVDDVPIDKRALTPRHLLQHTHGLDDFYHSTAYRQESGKTLEESSTDELLNWSLRQPLRAAPGEQWAYGVVGYVLLGVALERAGGLPFEDLADKYVFEPLGIEAAYGGSTTIVPARNPLLYELQDDRLIGHVVDFPQRVWPAGGLNISVNEFAKLFVALSGDGFLSADEKLGMWRQISLRNGDATSYGLGWMSYVTSRDRWVVGHEGGGASWVIYYPDLDLAVIALSNMSGARADSLPYEIARAGIESGLIGSQ